MSLNHRVITGGIMGKGSGKIIDCRASGTVSAVSAVSVRHISEGQGALGYQGVTVKVEIGGLIGHAERIDVKKSGNAAAIYTSSFISLKMIGSGGSFDDLLYVPEMDICAGGIAGYVNNGGTFMDTYNSGEVAVAACSRADGGHEAFEVIYTAGCVAGYNSDMTLTIKNFCNMGRIIYAPPADSLSTGIKQTYPVAPGKVENCYYLHLSGAQQSNATAIRDSDAADEGTFKGWDFGRTWTIRDGRPVISVCYDMSIKDMSGTFDGTVKYSLDREHSFDANGRSFSCVGGEGFVLTLSEGYENSEITVYMIDGGEKMILEDRGNNNYMVPPSFFLHAYLEGREISGIELYIEGLGINLPPVIEDIIDDPVIIITDALSEETGTAVLMMFGLLIAMLSAVTMYNARSTGSILTISAEVRGTHEDEENEHTG
jgi:hypothetical protein